MNNCKVMITCEDKSANKDKCKFSNSVNEICSHSIDSKLDSIVYCGNDKAKLYTLKKRIESFKDYDNK